jgi:4'-phosphopantetheinyl transferase
MAGNSETSRVVLGWAALGRDGTAGTDLFAVLDGEERLRADRLRRPADRSGFIAAHGLTRLLLGQLTGTAPAALRFDRIAGAKPRIAGYAGLDFSLTHTRGLVACAAARGLRVGLDAEALDTAIPAMAIARSYFSPDEAQRVATDGADAFFRLWTLKEAFLKATGAGLRRPLNTVAMRLDPPGLNHPAAGCWHFAQWRPTGGHLLALAIEGGSPAVPPIIEVTSYGGLDGGAEFWR